MGGFFIMAKILVFNNDTDRMETYYRGEAEPSAGKLLVNMINDLMK